MPTLTDDVNTVLNDLLRLYGDGQPSEQAMASLAQSVAADVNMQAGRLTVGYANLQEAHRALVETQMSREGIVQKAVGDSGNGTVTGRGVLNNHIADLQARIQAITAVADTRFSGPALLDSAHQTIASATKQVNSDVDAARRQATRIMPPITLQPRTGRASSTSRRRHRRRRPQQVMGRSRRRIRLPSDGTAGGRAVAAADAWLDTPYIWGGGGPGGPTNGGFDCSGLTQYAVAQATDGRVVLPRTTYEQIYAGERVYDMRDVRPGDLVFPAGSFSSRGPEHVQLAAGNGRVIEAPYSGARVQYSPMSSNSIVVRVM